MVLTTIVTLVLLEKGSSSMKYLEGRVDIYTCHSINVNFLRPSKLQKECIENQTWLLKREGIMIAFL